MLRINSRRLLTLAERLSVMSNLVSPTSVSPKPISPIHIEPSAVPPLAQLSAGSRIRPISRQQMLEHARDVIRHEAMALDALSGRINDQICVLADHILSAPGTVVVSGVGKALIVGEKISATLASTGTRSIALDPLDAMHGSLGRIGPGDIFLALSNSGETAELQQGRACSAGFAGGCCGDDRSLCILARPDG